MESEVGWIIAALRLLYHHFVPTNARDTNKRQRSGHYLVVATQNCRIGASYMCCLIDKTMMQIA